MAATGAAALVAARPSVVKLVTKVQRLAGGRLLVVTESGAPGASVVDGGLTMLFIGGLFLYAVRSAGPARRRAAAPPQAQDDAVFCSSSSSSAQLRFSPPPRRPAPRGRRAFAQQVRKTRDPETVGRANLVVGTYMRMIESSRPLSAPARHCSQRDHAAASSNEAAVSVAEAEPEAPADAAFGPLTVVLRRQRSSTTRAGSRRRRWWAKATCPPLRPSGASRRPRR